MIPLRLAHTHRLAGPSLPDDIGQHGYLRGVVVQLIVRRELVVPFELARVGIECDHAVAVEVVAEARAPIPVRRGIARAEIDQVGRGIIGAVIPDAGPTLLPRISRPGFHALLRPGPGWCGISRARAPSSRHRPR